MRRSLQRCLIAFAAMVLAGSGTLRCSETPSSPRLTITTSWVTPLDVERPSVKLHYSNGGSKLARILLPDGKEEQEYFNGLDVEIDGAEAQFRYYDPAIDDPAFSGIVELQQGDSHEIVIDLSAVYRLPEDWKRISVMPSPVGMIRPEARSGVTWERK